MDCYLQQAGSTSRLSLREDADGMHVVLLRQACWLWWSTGSSHAQSCGLDAQASAVMLTAWSHAAEACTQPADTLIVCSGLEEVPEEPYVLYMSTLTETGVSAVKQTACDRLLASRVEMKLQAGPSACPPHLEAT